MIGFFRRLIKDRRGNALVIAGASLPMIVGAAGLATDTIQWTLWKRQLQRAADSAAIAGVYDREQASGSSSTASAAVSHDLTLNLHTRQSLLSGYPVVTFPANSGSKTNQVAVKLAIQQRLPFSSLFMTSPPTIIVNATAASIPAEGDACVQALETRASATGITNSGNTTVFMPDCIMYSNSPSSNSASAGGSSYVTAKAIAAVGGIQQSNNWHVQQYIPYSPALPDPFAGVTPDPNVMHCTSSALAFNTNFSSLPAGTNCFSSLSVGPNKTLNVPANFGPIYINGGGADLKGTFNCTGCTIVLTNSNTSPTATIGTISSNAQATNNITAPTSGTFKGIAFYQDRRATGNTDKINGGSSSVITGALYFPSDVLWINGTGSATSLCAMFVARDIVFTGNSGISLKGLNDSTCASSGLPANNSVKMVRLVA
jgi:Flp pilus assembly protein TadG